MAALSKILDCTCYEVCHTWNPSCLGSIQDVFKAAFKFSFKTYFSLYLATGILSRKGLPYFMYKFMPQVLQSTVFLTTNAYTFITFMCLVHKYMGGFSYWAGLVSGTLASLIAILHERKSRRGVLALYMSNIATELVWNMLIKRGIIKSIPNGQVYLFCLVSAGYMYYYRRAGWFDKSTANSISIIAGKSDQGEPQQETIKTEEQNIPNSINNNETSQTNQKRVQEKRQGMIAAVKKYQHLLDQYLKHKTPLAFLTNKHSTCKHKNGCILDTLYQGIKMFGIGYAVQLAITIFSKISVLLKRPQVLRQMLFTKSNIPLAAFLGSYSTIFKALNCALRWCYGSDQDWFGLISGGCAGLSMMFFKSNAITLYLGGKLIEHMYAKAEEENKVPTIPYADIIIYTISTGLVFHAAVLEPQVIRPQYWSFLKKLTSNQFAEMNRHLMEVYGTNAAYLFKGWWPKYDPSYTSLVKPF